jgi:hypothetical protein
MRHTSITNRDKEVAFIKKVVDHLNSHDSISKKEFTKYAKEFNLL